MKHQKTLLAVLLTMSCITAHAASVADVTPATATVDFSQAMTLTHTLTPLSNLQAGAVTADTKLADGKITVTGGTPTIAIKASSSMQTGTMNAVILKGNNDPSHTLDVSFVNPDGTGMAADTGVAGGAVWFMPFDNENYIIQSASREQTVAADQYDISMDAGIWNN